MKKLIYAASAFLFFAGSAALAQTGNVGIGTSTPAAKLHVLGNVAIEDGSQGSGKVLTSDANGIASWQPGGYLDPDAPGFTAPLVSLGMGGANLVYGNGDWANNVITDLILTNEVSDANNLHDPATGIITIAEDGFYVAYGRIRLINQGTSTFDGNAGQYNTWLNVKPNGSETFVAISGDSKTVTRGLTIPAGQVNYHNIVSGSAFLKAGDQIKITFHTYGTNSMNSNTANIIIYPFASSFTLYKF